MIGPKKLASLSRPIRCKTTINHDLVARIFLPFGRFACFYSEFSLALQGIFLSSFHNNYFGFVLRHSIEKRSMNGNPYFPRRYKYSSSQRRNSSNLFFFGDICSLIKFVVSPCMITVTTSCKTTPN